MSIEDGIREREECVPGDLLLVVGSLNRESPYHYSCGVRRFLNH